MRKCKKCGSHAINPGKRGRDNTDLDLCDVCYWKKRAEDIKALYEEESRHVSLLEAVVVQHQLGLQDLWNRSIASMRYLTEQFNKPKTGG